MILAYEWELEPGKIYTDSIFDDDGNVVKATFLVIKEVSKSDYLKSVLDDCGELKMQYAIAHLSSADKFYLVSTD